MKVLIVGSYPTVSTKPSGGVEAATVNLVDALAMRDDIEVTVLALEANCVGPASLSIGPVTIMRRSTGGPVGRISRTRSALSQVLLEERPDIVHAQGAGRFLPAARPSVLTVHGLIERDLPFQKSGIARYLRRATVVRTEVEARNSAPNVIAISNHFLEELPPLSARRVWKIPNAVNAGLSPCLTPPLIPSILYVGHISELKNVALLIRAFAKLLPHIPQLRLRLIGAGSSGYATMCADLARSLGVSDSVYWLGALSREETTAQMQQATVLALTSQTEVAPMVISESLTIGLPVVATDVGGVAEMLNAEGGTVVPSNNPFALAQALAAVIDSPNPRSLREKARAMSAVYQPEHVASQTVNCYKEILSRS